MGPPIMAGSDDPRRAYCTRCPKSITRWAQTGATLATKPRKQIGDMAKGRASPGISSLSLPLQCHRPQPCAWWRTASEVSREDGASVPASMTVTQADS